jgi:heme-degrading monooxygenase HmoA
LINVSNGYTMKFSKFFFAGVLASAMFAVPVLTSAGSTKADAVIEVATFQLKQGVTPAEFAVVDKAMEREYIARQPGFLSRETAAGPNNEWLVIVHWKSLKDADASMASFEKAAPTVAFMAKLDATTMSMKRYQNRSVDKH